MTNQEKLDEKPKNRAKFIEASPIMATITFSIPAYQDRDGTPFKRVIKLPTKKCYAVFKKLAERW